MPGEPKGSQLPIEKSVAVRRAVGLFLRRLNGDVDISIVCPVLGVLYAATLGGLVAVGFRPAIPWRFLPYLAFAVLPFAIVVTSTLIVIDRQAPRGRLVKLAAAAGGIAAVYAYGGSILWIPAALGLTIVVRREFRNRARPLCLALVSLLFGYASVWNANYILGWLMRNRVADSTLQRADQFLYGLWLGGTPAWAGLFPLVRNPLAFRLLEHAYLALFGEVLIAVLWLAISATSTDLGNFFKRLFLAYGFGLAIFILYPAVGPPIFDPDSFDVAFRGSLTFSIMDQMATEYRAVAAHGRLNGFGYFVALPSLHTLVAVFILGVVRRTPLLFWFLLPITSLLVGSTFLLGYHYLLDVGIAVPLGCLFVPSNR